MHAPHGRLAPPGWRRSAKGRLWRDTSAGETVTLIPPAAAWRLLVYGGSDGRGRSVDVTGTGTETSEAEAARLALRELGIELPQDPAWTRGMVPMGPGDRRVPYAPKGRR